MIVAAPLSLHPWKIDGPGSRGGAAARRWLRFVLTVVLFLGASAPVLRAADTDDLLSTERWHENAFGLSLRPPLASRLKQSQADEATLHIIGDGDAYFINLYIKTSKEPLSVDKVYTTIVNQIGIQFPSAKILEQMPNIKVGGRDGGRIYLRIPDQTQRGTWMLGQAFFILQADSYAVLEFKTRPAAYDLTKAVFEAVLASVQFEDLLKLSHDRIEMVTRGTAWREKLRPTDLQQAMIGQQWLRILQNGTDVGYMKVTQSTDNELGLAGLRVDVQAHMEIKTGATPRLPPKSTTFDSTSHYFLANDRDTEIWSTKTIAHLPKKADPKPDKLELQPMPVRDEANTVSETATRSKSKITITRESGGHTREFHWDLTLPRDLPDQDPNFVQHLQGCYLSQVELYLLPRLLQARPAGTLGFYAYYPNEEKLAFRTERVESKPDGSYIVYSRPTPENAEQVSFYSATGILVKRELPGGQVLLPASRDEVRLKWNVD